MRYGNGCLMLRYFSVSAVVIALDLLSKHWITKLFVEGEHLVVTSFFDLVLFYNPGAAFSFLADAGGWQRVFFTLIALIAVVVIVRLIKQSPERQLYCFSLSLIMGGALGNLVDRVRLGHVVDFLYFHYQTHDFPAFNVADSAISVGVALLLLDSFKQEQTKNA